MKPPSRRLNADETALWRRVAATVTPMHPTRHGHAPAPEPAPALPRSRQLARPALPPAPVPVQHRRPTEDLSRHGLDGGWDRRLAKGGVQPDFTLDLHGCTLDQAHARLDHGLTQALAHGARVVLLITGRPRGCGDHGGRGERRGAIRAKFLDWLEAGPHSGRIAAIRPAHPRHGGAGAVYLILRRG